MQVFLTGATGYIGSAVLDAMIKGGHQVTALARAHQALDAAKSAYGGATAVERAMVDALADRFPTDPTIEDTDMDVSRTTGACEMSCACSASMA